MLVNKLVCTRCGTMNDDDAKYCKECGSGKNEGVKVKVTEAAGYELCTRCGTTKKVGEECGCYRGYYAGGHVKELDIRRPR